MRFRVSMPPDAVVTLQARLGVKLRRTAHLARALRHRSASSDAPQASNERLEFLGDAVLGLIVGEWLHATYPDWDEGQLAKARAVLVSEPTLAEVSVSTGIPDALVMSAGEEAAGGRARPSILADAYEAVVAAVYLDRGLRAARTFVLQSLAPWLAAVGDEGAIRDHKSALQERIQAVKHQLPTYVVVDETGADHDKTFTVHALDGEEVLGVGTGKSKKQAEQQAARAALARMEVDAAVE